MKQQQVSKLSLEQTLEQMTVKQYCPVSKKRGTEAVVYTRVSSQEQANNNGSLDVQLKYCNDFCKANNLTIREYFGGTFESAKTDGRKEFQRMLEYVRKQKSISHIIIFNYDRFSRTGSGAAQLSEQLRSEGIILKSVTQDIDTSTAAGRLQENFFHMINNFDNSAKSDRTKINTREVMMKGFWPYAPPLGYKNNKAKHRACYHEYVITEEGQALKKAFILKAEGKHSNREIIDLLNAKGVGITAKNIRWILSNPFYAGYVTGKLVEGKLIKGKHPALIDLKTFLKANELLQHSTGAGIPKEFRHEEVPLKVFAKDEESGSTFTGYKTKGNWYYKTKASPTPVNVRADELNSLFLDSLKGYEYNKGHKAKLMKLIATSLKEQMAEAIADTKLLKKQITEKQAQFDKVEEGFILGNISKELYDKYSDKYKKELADLAQKTNQSGFDGSNLENSVEKCLKIAENLSSAWLEAKYENKQRLQQLVFPEGVVYSKKDRAVRTLRVNSIFAQIPIQARVLEEKENGDSVKNRHKSNHVPQTGIEPVLALLQTGF